MKTFNKILSIGTAILTVISTSGCKDFLTTNPSASISDTEALSSVGQIEKSLVSAYNQLLFNTSGGEDRIFAGIPGMQMFWDLRGQDIMSHENMGGYQCSSYNFSPSFTRADGNANIMWTFCYKLINQCNIIIDALPEAEGDAAKKTLIDGQAKAMRGIAYFYLIMTYQQTYAIAKDKRGVILRLSASDPEEMGFSTVQAIYDQIVKDLEAAKSELAGYDRDYIWKINAEVVNGWLARVYQVMNNWDKSFECAKAVYDNHSTLLTKDQWYSGFDDCITNNYQEVVWAMSYTAENNLGGGTQFNFWHNQDPFTYGENQKGIYRFFDFFVTPDYVALFDTTDWRGARLAYDCNYASPEELEAAELKVMFWRRQFAGSTDWNSKWAYNKYKHYGDEAFQTRPDICLMRGTEMLLIMAEAKANQDKGTDALALLNTLQSARNAQLTTTTAKADLLEEIYKERRKELLGEGVTGQYDMVRLQKSLTRYYATPSYPAGHYIYGVNQLDNFDLTAAQPYGYLPSNDYRWFFQIPDGEYSYNHEISYDDQNPFKGQ